MSFNYNQQQSNYKMPQQWAPQPQMQIPQYIRPVSSIEEARVCPIDFDGSIFYFPDMANKRIYTKQINMDGTVNLNVYEQKEFPIVSNANFITREEFESAIETLKKSLTAPKQEEIKKIQF